MHWETFTFLRCIRSCLCAELHLPGLKVAASPAERWGVYGLVGERDKIYPGEGAEPSVEGQDEKLVLERAREVGRRGRAGQWCVLMGLRRKE